MGKHNDTRDGQTSTHNRPQASDSYSPTTEKGDSVPSSSSGSGTEPDQQKESLPHSKTVRGTLAHKGGAKVNRSMLGDPVSLKSETSKSEGDRGAGSTKDDQGMKKTAEKRAKNEKSKL
jgi:hypothetical protein